MPAIPPPPKLELLLIRRELSLVEKDETSSYASLL